MKILFSIIFSFALVAGIALQFYSQETPELASTKIYPKTKLLPDFDLIAHDDSKFTNQNLIGKWSIVFFGYTSCPDVCPTTMAALSQVENALSSDQKQQVQFIFVSVDPERDTTKVLAEYVPFYHKDFIGVTGESDNILQFALSLGAAYMKLPAKSGYQMSHSSTVFIINPKGQRFGLFSRLQNGAMDTTAVAKDLINIIKYY